MGRIGNIFGRRNKTVTETPKPLPVEFRAATISLTVKDNGTGLPINNASVSLHVDNDRGLFFGELINQNGFYSINVPAELPKPYGGDILVVSEGYVPRVVRTVIPNGEQITLEESIGLDQDFIFAKETGLVKVNGVNFTNNGVPWYMRGVTMFMLFARYMRGEDVTPQFNWMRKNGFNTARVLGPVDWPDWPYRNVDWNKLHEFFALASVNGIRIMWVPITTRENASNHLSLVINSYEVADRFDNVIVQVCNEPLKDSKCDPVDLYSHIYLREGQHPATLTDFGLYWADDWPNEWPLADFGSTHLTREYPKFARKSKDLLELRQKFNHPFIHDEPIGVAENAIEGRRTNDISAILSDVAVAMLCGNGYVYHFESGIQGLVPQAGSVQDAVAQQLSALFQFIPVNANQGSYCAPHIPGFPVAWQESDSAVGHAYGMILGNTAFVVNVLARQGWQPVGINGWTVSGSFSDSICRLSR